MLHFKGLMMEGHVKTSRAIQAWHLAAKLMYDYQTGVDITEWASRYVV